MSLSNTQRVLVFGLGVLMGTAILMISKSGKKQAVAEQLQQDAQHGFVIDQHFLPGQEVNARKPLHIDPSMIVYNTPPDPSNNQLDRYILTNSRFSKFDKELIKERIWKDPKDGFERLIRRQYMEANQIQVRVRDGVGDRQLAHFLDHFKLILGSKKTEKLYFVSLPKTTASAVPEAITLLNSQADSILEEAFPVYLDPN